MMTASELYARLAGHGLGRCDIHTHTVFCDGKNTPAQMAKAALEAGLSCLGFSGHAYMSFDPSWCMAAGEVARYRAEVMELRERYAGRLDILLGIEQDLYAEAVSPEAEYDYIIGSVHYLRAPDGRYLPLDESPEVLAGICRDYYGGDWMALAEHYYATVADLARMTPAPTVIGHLDLITKFNQGGAQFDEGDPRYLAAARGAVEALLPTGALFEVNHGAISRGWRQEPYPSAVLQESILACGGVLVPTGDSHRAEDLGRFY